MKPTRRRCSCANSCPCYRRPCFHRRVTGMSMFVVTDSLLERKQGHDPAPLPTEQGSGYETIKVMLDFSFALMLFILTMPLMLVAIILIKITSPGPAIYTQTRMGKHGK